LVGVHHIHRDALWLDQMSFWIDGAPGTISHALYNLTLYAISGAVSLGNKILSSR